jgi:hypothetical protein
VLLLSTTCSQPHFSQLPICTNFPLVPMQKIRTQQENTSCTFDLHIRKKLVKCYIWSITLYGTETQSLWNGDQNIWKILICGTEDKYSRSVGLIMRTMKKYYVH